MTRRERHIRILESFGLRDPRVLDAIRSVTYRNMDAFTDDAIEQITAFVWDGHKRTQKINRENRAIYAARQAKGAA